MFFFKRRTAYEGGVGLEFGRVLFRSRVSGGTGLMVIGGIGVKGLRVIESDLRDSRHGAEGDRE